MKPLVLKTIPFLKAVVWGGQGLQARYGKEADPGRPLGESWEVSAIPGFESGLVGWSEPLSQAFRKEPRAFYRHYEGGDFPLLVKLLCTARPLSLQVHPDDAQARALAGAKNGKRECWLVLEAKPGAYLHLGLRQSCGLEDLKCALEKNDPLAVAGVMRRVAARPGQVFDIQPGTLHAIGPGLILLEVQQPCDLTFRVHDWGRRGLDGRPRALHREEAFQVIEAGLRPEARPAGAAVAGGAGRLLLDHRAFRLERWRVEGRLQQPVKDLCIFVTLKGSGRLRADEGAPVELERGCSCLVPGVATMLNLEGRALELAVIHPPNPEV